MRKNIYEILEEIEAAPTEQDKMRVIFYYNTQAPTLKNVFRLVFDPQYEFYIKEMPGCYKTPDTVAGISFSNLDQELRKLYLFRKGDPTAEQLGEIRREELFCALAESLEPKEAQVLLNIMNKDLKVPGIDKKFIKKVFPDIF